MEAAALAGIERRGVLGLTGRSSVVNSVYGLASTCNLTHYFLGISENVLAKHL